MAAKAALGEEDAAVVVRLLTQVPTLGMREPVVKKLTRSFLKFVDAAKHGSAAAAQDAFQAVLLEIDRQHLESQRFQHVVDANTVEQQRYEAKQQHLQAEIAQALQDIENKKQELDDARIGRQHNEEYEVIRALIAEEAQRAHTQQQIDAVEQEIQAIRTEAARATQTMERRRKQFALLFHCIEDLQRVQDDDQLELQEGSQPMQVDMV